MGDRLWLRTQCPYSFKQIEWFNNTKIIKKNTLFCMTPSTDLVLTLVQGSLQI